MKYENIKMPEELLKFMDENISYGYLDKNGKIHRIQDKDFNEDWFNLYRLENNQDVLNTKVGNCFDQVEFERTWFINNGYEIKTIFEMVLLDYENPYPMHSFLAYKEYNKWYLFEHADFANKGIRGFNNILDLINYQLYTYKIFLKKDFKIKDEELEKIYMSYFEEPKNHANEEEYIEFVTRGKNIL